MEAVLLAAQWDPRMPDQGITAGAKATSGPDLSTEAQHQVGDYYLGLNGLANRRPYDGPQVTKVAWEAWEAYKRAHEL